MAQCSESLLGTWKLRQLKFRRAIFANSHMFRVQVPSRAAAEPLVEGWYFPCEFSSVSAAWLWPLATSRCLTWFCIAASRSAAVWNFDKAKKGDKAKQDFSQRVAG